MTLIHNKLKSNMRNKTCVICLERHYPQNVSNCLNCLESGIMCHDCEDKWVLQNNNRETCIVCKQRTKQNIKVVVQIEEREQRMDTEWWIQCELLFVILFLALGLITMIVYGIFWIIYHMS